MLKGSRVSCGPRSHALRLLLLILLCATETIVALKCRSESGLSDAELKRVARTCMRKIGESALRSDNGNEHGNDNDSGSFLPASAFGFSNNNNNNNHNNNGQTRAQQDVHGGYYSNYDDAVERNHNNNHPTGNYERSDDIWRQRNRDRSQMNRTSRTTKSPTNTERESHDRRQSGSGSAYHYGNNGHQQHGNAGNDSACLAHCFFGQLHMLNNDDYPDRHKVSYLLSKDLRDRELRNFYAETIEQCFHYAESPRRRDKCHFSRELISCMSEYAQANCEDWQQYSVIFN